MNGDERDLYDGVIANLDGEIGHLCEELEKAQALIPSIDTLSAMDRLYHNVCGRYWVNGPDDIPDDVAVDLEKMREWMRKIGHYHCPEITQMRQSNERT